jgi:hypothetical protein
MVTGGAEMYSDFMNDKRHFFHNNKIRLVLCAALLGTLSGCVGYVNGPSAGYYDQPGAVVAQDDYVYYPQYECYYSISRRQYAYREGHSWVARSAPHGVSARVLMASPSVKMNFHDSPAQHHAQVVKQYPKNWKPSGSNQGQNRKDDQPDGHGDNHAK